MLVVGAKKWLVDGGHLFMEESSKISSKGDGGRVGGGGLSRALKVYRITCMCLLVGGGLGGRDRSKTQLQKWFLSVFMGCLPWHPFLMAILSFVDCT